MFRELRESEISFAVSAYEDMLNELNCEEIDIIPTRKTLETFYDILSNNYKYGIRSYVSTDNKLITGYAVFVSDSIFFDTKLNGVYFACLYIEPDYRGNGILNRLLQYSEAQLRESKIQKVSINLLNRGIGRIAKRYGLDVKKSLEKTLD